MDNKSLTEHLIDNWKKPLKTVSFWIISISLILARDQFLRSGGSIGDIYISSDALDWMVVTTIIFIYIFSRKIDAKIKSIMS